MHIRDWPACERPREKLLSRGPRLSVRCRAAGDFPGLGHCAAGMRSPLRASCCRRTARLRGLLDRSPRALTELPGLARRAPAPGRGAGTRATPSGRATGTRRGPERPVRRRSLFRPAAARAATRGVRRAVPGHPPSRTGFEACSTAASMAPRCIRVKWSSARWRRRGGRDRRPQPSQRQSRAQRRRSRRDRAPEAGAGPGRRPPARPFRHRRRRAGVDGRARDGVNRSQERLPPFRRRQRLAYNATPLNSIHLPVVKTQLRALIAEQSNRASTPCAPLAPCPPTCPARTS